MLRIGSTHIPYGKSDYHAAIVLLFVFADCAISSTPTDENMSEVRFLLIQRQLKEKIDLLGGSMIFFVRGCP